MDATRITPKPNGPLVVEGLPPNRFVTEVTNGTASQTPLLQASLPRFEHRVLCCLRPGRGRTGGAAPDRTRCTPPPCRAPEGGAQWRRLEKPRWPRMKATV